MGPTSDKIAPSDGRRGALIYRFRRSKCKYLMGCREILGVLWMSLGIFLFWEEIKILKGLKAYYLMDFLY